MSCRGCGPRQSDLNFTLALAVVTIVLMQYYGVKAQRGAYFKKFFDLSGFKQGALMGIIGVFVGILELIGELSRLLSFSFRLFGNIFAGEVLLLVMAFLIPYFASLPFYGLELFVGFIQAAVFMMLAVVFISMATEGHGGGRAWAHETRSARSRRSRSRRRFHPARERHVPQSFHPIHQSYL